MFDEWDKDTKIDVRKDLKAQIPMRLSLGKYMDDSPAGKNDFELFALVDQKGQDRAQSIYTAVVLKPDGIWR